MTTDTAVTAATTQTPAPAAQADVVVTPPAAADPAATKIETKDDGPGKSALNVEPAKTGNEDKPAGEADGKKADSEDGQGQDKDEEKTEGAPEAYADFTLPENMEVNAGVLDKFKGMAKAANLPQGQAQEFVGLGAEIVTEAVEDYHASITENYAKKVDSWHQTRFADKEIGGATEEAQMANLSRAAKAVKAIGGENLMTALDETGAGNHPEIIRAFFRLSEIVGEDGKLIQGNLGGSDVTAAQALYPSLPSKT